MHVYILLVDHTENDRKTIEQFSRAVDKKAGAIEESTALFYLNLINHCLQRVVKNRSSMGKVLLLT